jgi:hypothetical protein
MCPTELALVRMDESALAMKLNRRGRVGPPNELHAGLKEGTDLPIDGYGCPAPFNQLTKPVNYSRINTLSMQHLRQKVPVLLNFKLMHNFLQGKHTIGDESTFDKRNLIWADYSISDRV